MTGERRATSDSRYRSLLLAGALALAFLLLPLVAFIGAVPWERWASIIMTEQFGAALLVSLLVSTCALVLSLLLGVPAAWLLARHRFPGRDLLRVFVLLPMVMPPVVAGVALLATFGRRGIFGASLEALGVSLPFTSAGAIVAATFVASPFVIVALEAAFRSTDPLLEAAAATLGASRLRIFFTVVLPQARPALLSGAALCWARALGEFGATIAFAGNVAGKTRTLPLAVYDALQTDFEQATALGSLLLLVSLAVLAWRMRAL